MKLKLFFILFLFLYSCNDDRNYIPEKIREPFLYYSYNKDDIFYMIKNNKDTIQIQVTDIEIYFENLTYFNCTNSDEYATIEFSNGGLSNIGNYGSYLYFFNTTVDNIYFFYDSLKINNKYYYSVYELRSDNELEKNRIFTSTNDGILYVDNGVDEYVLLFMR